jgi:4-hydroxy-2-oxoheptanedioate aldolase
MHAIFSVPGIDACFIGPNDLCASMGLLPSLEPPHREFDEAIRTILAAARRHGVAPGIHHATAATASRRIAGGWRLVGCGRDIAYVTAGAQAAHEALRTG